jgi:hypothetical protein
LRFWEAKSMAMPDWVTLPGALALEEETASGKWLVPLTSLWDRSVGTIDNLAPLLRS